MAKFRRYNQSKARFLRRWSLIGKKYHLLKTLRRRFYGHKFTK